MNGQRCRLLDAAAAGSVLADGESLQIIDARPYSAYLHGHIPGSIWLGWEDWCGAAPASAGTVLSQPGYWGKLDEREPAQFGAALTGLGLRHDRPILVYAGGRADKGRDGRIAWMLLYLGAVDVALLDGGWGAWMGAGYPLALATTLESGRSAGPVIAPALLGSGFEVAIRSERRARHEMLVAGCMAGHGPCPVDTRTAAEYSGALYEYLPRKGRMPGALSFAFDDLYDQHDRFIAREAYLRRAPDGAGRGLVAYCEVGVRAATMALLHEIYTGTIVPVYDGSLMEWALDRTLPMERDRDR